MENSIIRQHMIIPHPNEMKIITELQRKLCSRMMDLIAETNTSGYFAPLFPLYIPVPDAAYAATVCSCMLGSPVYSETGIGIPAELGCTAPHTGTVVLNIGEFKKLKINLSLLENIPENQDFSLNLPVFRIAEVEIQQSAAGIYWTVIQSRWIKGQKTTQPAG
jgi:hypothetical protein